MSNKDLLYDNSIKIVNYAELLKGYCENADGRQVFVECIIFVADDIGNLAQQILEEI